MQANYSNSPAQVMTAFMQVEIDRQKERIGFHTVPLDRRPALHAVAPGIVTLANPYGENRRELSLMGALRILGEVPDRSGPELARSALSKAIGQGAVRAHVHNSLTHVQVGDTQDGYVVMSVLDGRKVGSGKNGDPIPSASRQDLANHGRKFAVTYEGPDGGYWRYGDQIKGLSSKLPPPRRSLPEMRLLHREIRAEIERETRALRSGTGSPERLVNFSRMGTAARRMLDVVNGEPVSEKKAEFAFLKLRQRDLDHLGKWLNRPAWDYGLTFVQNNPALVLANASIQEEKDEVRKRIVAVAKAIRAGRPEREAGPRP